MPSNLNYDAKLLEQAKTLGKFKYKTETVNAALAEYVQRHSQPQILKLFGKIEYAKNYDYKKGRKRK